MIRRRAMVALAFGAVCTARFSHADPLAMEVRQVVIRAPEAEVLTLMTSRKTDAELAGELWQVVKDGRGHVVSDVTSAADGRHALNLSAGEHFWHPTENDQEMDRLFMTPVAYEERFVGTSLHCSPRVMNPDVFDGHVEAEWKTKFSPRGPVSVQWPTSWLDIYDHKAGKPSGKAIHGWLDWRDLFEETISGRVGFSDAGPTLIAILPPGDQAWGEKQNERCLDVFLAQIARPGLKKAPRTTPNASSPGFTRTLLFGIGMDAKEAMTVMADRDPSADAVLLQSLLAKTAQGNARIYLCAGSANDPAQDRQLQSARLHHYPAEMPSIPSAWETQKVGTSWQMSGDQQALQQDLAPPAQSEWQLALDVPEAIMRMPRFRGLDIQTTTAGSGTHLLSLLHIPAVMHGDGVRKDETVLIFSQASAESGPASGFEAEMIVFEVPAIEEPDWQPADDDQRPDVDAARFQNLLDRVNSGTASLMAHAVVHGRDGCRVSARMSEDWKTATEFSDPPRPTSPLRTRPTALETLHVGSQWEVDFHSVDAGDPRISLNHTFQQSTARPVEPSLQEVLAIAAKDNRHRGAVHPIESWSGSLNLLPNEPRCLGSRQPPGVDRAVRHVAFIRARRLAF